MLKKNHLAETIVPLHQNTSDRPLAPHGTIQNFSDRIGGISEPNGMRDDTKSENTIAPLGIAAVPITILGLVISSFFDD